MTKKEMTERIVLALERIAEQLSYLEADLAKEKVGSAEQTYHVKLTVSYE